MMAEESVGRADDGGGGGRTSSSFSALISSAPAPPAPPAAAGSPADSVHAWSSPIDRHGQAQQPREAQHAERERVEGTRFS